MRNTLRMSAVLKKTDIQSRKDIECVIFSFYEKIHKDSEMAKFFQIQPDAWEIHLERTTNFWENWLFQTGTYQGGLLWAHIQKHKKIPMKISHFEKWLSYWHLSVDEHFMGEKATFMKNKAIDLGNFLHHRLQHV